MSVLSSSVDWKELLSLLLSLTKSVNFKSLILFFCLMQLLEILTKSLDKLLKLGVSVSHTLMITHWITHQQASFYQHLFHVLLNIPLDMLDLNKLGRQYALSYFGFPQGNHFLGGVYISLEYFQFDFTHQFQMIICELQIFLYLSLNLFL